MSLPATRPNEPTPVGCNLSARVLRRVHNRPVKTVGEIVIAVSVRARTGEQSLVTKSPHIPAYRRISGACVGTSEKAGSPLAVRNPGPSV